MASYMPRRPRCCLMTSSVLVFLVVYVNSMCVPPAAASASFEFNAYCQKLCLWGRGGNLCRCNAVHFVGKRRVATPLFQTAAAGRSNVDALPSSSDQLLSPPELGTTIDVVQAEDDDQHDNIRHGDDTYTELDEDGSGVINSASSRSAAAGSVDKASGSRLINGSRDVDHESPVHVVDIVDQPGSAGKPSVDIDVDLVGDFERQPVVVVSDDDDDGFAADTAVDTGSDGADELIDAASGEKAIRGLQSQRNKRKLVYVASPQRNKFSSKRRRPTNKNNNKNRQQAALMAFNMLTRKPGNFRLVKPATIHAAQTTKLHKRSK